MVSRQIAVAFHGIGQPARALDPGEPRYWISQDRFLAFLDLVARAPDPKAILLTFDDGNASDHDIAMPAMLDRGLTGSFFPIADRLDRVGSLGTAQVRALAAAGMTVGSHGIHHLDWRKLDDRTLEAELAGSKELLERCIGQPVMTASLPFGRYDTRVLSALRKAGYQRVYSTDGGPSRPEDEFISRSNVRNDTTVEDFADLLRCRDGLHTRIIRRLKALRRKFT